jgi:hypothetical protein
MHFEIATKSQTTEAMPHENHDSVLRRLSALEACRRTCAAGARRPGQNFDKLSAALDELLDLGPVDLSRHSAAPLWLAGVGADPGVIDVVKFEYSLRKVTVATPSRSIHGDLLAWAWPDWHGYRFEVAPC